MERNDGHYHLAYHKSDAGAPVSLAMPITEGGKWAKGFVHDSAWICPFTNTNTSASGSFSLLTAKRPN
ncbi:MAG: hypothetical protein JNL70_14585 [Saprospiraceae bacterium]|nr:hypothetical protein [Saprospiraceae bacterium]